MKIARSRGEGSSWARILSRLPGLCVLVLVPKPALAWENDCSHPQIIQNAISLLNTSANYYRELSDFSILLSKGAHDEDVPDPQVVDHFYDAHTGMPLHTSVGSDNTLLELTALEFSTVPDGPLTTAIDRGNNLFNMAVQDYPWSRSLAYTELGHALHLLTQDMTQPGHTHNDPHIPYIYQGIAVLTGPEVSVVRYHPVLRGSRRARRRALKRDSIRSVSIRSVDKSGRGGYS